MTPLNIIATIGIIAFIRIIAIVASIAIRAAVADIQAELLVEILVRYVVSQGWLVG